MLTPPLSCNDVSESHEDIPSLGHHRTQSYENAINSSHESSTDYLTLIKVKMSDLDIPEGEEFQRRYNGYWAYVIAIVLFYAIPTYQLVLTYQKVLYVLDIVNVGEVISEGKFQMFELRVIITRSVYYQIFLCSITGENLMYCTCTCNNSHYL